MNKTRIGRSTASERRVEGSAASVIRARARRERNPAKKARPEVVRLRDDDSVMDGMLLKVRPIIDSFRDGDHLHVSDVIHKCLRQIALAKSLDMRPAVKRLNDSQALTFRQGSVIHDFVRDRLKDDHPDAVYGMWKCLCGHTTTPPMLYSQVTKKHECERCQTVPSRYEELSIADDEYGMTGSPDILMRINALQAYHVGEIKSIAGKSFNELARPLPDHVIQVVFYWHLMRRAGYTVTDKVSILYVNKEYSFKRPYKEFLVDAQKEEKRLQPYIEDLLGYNRYMGGDEDSLPVRTCPKIDAPDAKECSVRVTCFNSDR